MLQVNYLLQVVNQQNLQASVPINLKDILFAVMYIGILGPYRHFQLFIEVLPRDKIIPIIFLGISYSHYRQNLQKRQWLQSIYESKQTKSKWRPFLLSFHKNFCRGHIKFKSLNNPSSIFCKAIQTTKIVHVRSCFISYNIYA